MLAVRKNRNGVENVPASVEKFSAGVETFL